METKNQKCSKTFLLPKLVALIYYCTPVLVSSVPVTKDHPKAKAKGCSGFNKMHISLNVQAPVADCLGRIRGYNAVSQDVTWCSLKLHKHPTISSALSGSYL